MDIPKTNEGLKPQIFRGGWEGSLLALCPAVIFLAVFIASWAGSN